MNKLLITTLGVAWKNLKEEKKSSIFDCVLLTHGTQIACIDKTYVRNENEDFVKQISISISCIAVHFVNFGIQAAHTHTHIHSKSTIWNMENLTLKIGKLPPY